MKEYKIKLSNNKKAKTVSIELSGQLNVTNILDIKNEIGLAIKNSKTINFKVINVDDADLTIIQLIVALKKQCRASEIDLNIDFDLNNDSLELIKRAGFVNTFS